MEWNSKYMVNEKVLETRNAQSLIGPQKVLIGLKSALKVPKVPIKHQFWYFLSKLRKKSKSEMLHPNEVLFTRNYPLVCGNIYKE